MLILVKLILAHLIGDFLLQPRSWVEHKERLKTFAPQLYYHCAVHGVLVALVLWGSWSWLWGLAITVVHYAIDVVKISFQSPQSKSRWFVADQVMHFVSLVIAGQLWIGEGVAFGYLLQMPELWVYSAAVLFLSIVGRIGMEVLLSNWAMVLPEAKDESLANAGKYIGILERLLVFVFVVLGRWEAVGFLLAAKSVFRFGDLTQAKDRKLTEYILIGTLLSFGIAILTGMAVVKILSMC